MSAETHTAAPGIRELGKALEEAKTLEQKPWHFLFSLCCNKLQIFYGLLVM